MIHMQYISPGDEATVKGVPDITYIWNRPPYSRFVWDGAALKPIGGGSVALTNAEFAALVAADGLQLGIIYRVGTPEVWYRATGVDTYTPVSAGADYVDVSVPGADDYTIEV